MLHTASLDSFPSNVQVPDSLKERFWYDAQRRRLCFDGFMSKAHYDQLHGLVREQAYHNALDELFRVCTPEVEQPRRQVTPALVATLTAVAALSLGAAAAWYMGAFS